MTTSADRLVSISTFALVLALAPAAALGADEGLCRKALGIQDQEQGYEVEKRGSLCLVTVTCSGDCTTVVPTAADRGHVTCEEIDLNDGKQNEAIGFEIEFRRSAVGHGPARMESHARFWGYVNKVNPLAVPGAPRTLASPSEWPHCSRYGYAGVSQAADELRALWQLRRIEFFLNEDPGNAHAADRTLRTDDVWDHQVRRVEWEKRDGSGGVDDRFLGHVDKLLTGADEERIRRQGSAIALVTGSETLDGSFYWSGRDRTGDLEAIFTPAGEGRWSAEFHFVWEDAPHVYSGPVQGSLTGELSGTIHNENKEYEFTFSGTFAGKKFSGTHQMIDQAGSPIEMGTLELIRR